MSDRERERKKKAEEKIIIKDILEVGINWLDKEVSIENVYNALIKIEIEVKKKDTTVFVKKYKNLKLYRLEEIIGKMEESYHNKSNQYVVKTYSINKAIVQILEKLLNLVNQKVSANSIYNIEIENKDNNVKSEFLIKKGLGYLKYLFLSIYTKKGKYTYYEVDINSWFKEQKYMISDIKVLKSLLPILIAYVKSDYDCNIKKFFEIINSLIYYAIQPYQNHNNLFDLENEIYKSIYIETDNIDDTSSDTSQDLTIGILNINDKNHPIKNIDITPKRIIINSDKSKTLEYENEDLEIEKVDLIDIVRIKVDANTKGAIQLKGGKNYYIYNDIFKSFYTPKYDYKEEEHKIVLEISNSAYSYYQLKPLDKTVIYDTEEKKEIFQDMYIDYEIKDNHFYLIANDTISNATSIILHTLNEVKIIEPKILNDSLNDKISQFNMKQ
jgi:hypothetical protein